MARRTINITLGQALADGKFNSSATSATSAVAASIGTLQTDVEAAVAVLVADGVTPTQAHVNTAAAAWALLLAAINVAPNVVVDFDDAVVTSQNALRAAVAAALKDVAGSGLAVG